MFGRLEIAYDQRDNVLTIPRAALIEDEGESAVYIVRSGKAIRVPIKTGYSNGEIAEVISGLRQGDKVITAGKVAVRDGSKVSVIGIDGKAVIVPRKVENKSGDN
jgi:membrane fusion protein (multidrug efflux system)